MTEIPSSLFLEPARAVRSLKSLEELFLNSGSGRPKEEFTGALAAALTGSPDPDLAVTNLVRFIEAATSKTAIFNDLIRHAVLMDLLVRLLSYSQYFADILVRDPELFRWLTTADSLVSPRTKEFLRREAERTMSVFQKPERKLDALRRLYRREILRTGARDILGDAGLGTVTAELSHLADVLVEAACAIAHQQLAGRYPSPPETPYAVIALGKLGGGELNYSSDIDIIVVYDEEGELADGTGRTYHEYFNAFVEKMVQNLSLSTAEGHLYRVDTRLRPEGGAGPLARSLQGYLLHYEMRGELWERQMLIKARTIAGDAQFGGKFLAQLDPFIYPRSFFENPKSSIARIKARIEAELDVAENVKLRAGGIRDIEFVVQALQLLNGGKNRAIRSGNTLDAIAKLGEAKLLSAQEQQTLTDAYVFFRTVEHRLQTMLNTQTHELPKDARTLDALAKKVGIKSAAGFRTRNDRLLSGVRHIFDSVLAVDTAGHDVTLSSIIEGDAGRETIERFLKGKGFQDGRKAARNLATLIAGGPSLGSRETDLRTRNAFRKVAQPLFGDIIRTPMPDMTMHNLAVIAARQKFREQFYGALAEDNFRRLLVTVCSVSPRFAKGLSMNPLLLETLATEPHSLSSSTIDTWSPRDSLVTVKNREELRAGIRYVLGISAFEELSAELTLLADFVLAETAKAALAELRLRKIPFAIFALGKYGSREITFDSDLDVLFVADAKTGSDKDRLEKCAAAIMKNISAFSSEGRLYAIDARLRPEGKSAPLVVDKQAYLAYLGKRASLWERQSLTRLRFVTGHEQLGNEVVREVGEFVYGTALPPQWVDTIVDMRKKTETRSHFLSASLLDIKLGEGGMVDIEFLAQMIQLKFGPKHAQVRSRGTTNALYAGGLLMNSPEAANQLIATYQIYRRLETLLRITLDERGTIIPEGEKLEDLAKSFSGTTGGELVQLVSARCTATREFFEALTGQLKTIT